MRKKNDINMQMEAGTRDSSSAEENFRVVFFSRLQMISAWVAYTSGTLAKIQYTVVSLDYF